MKIVVDSTWKEKTDIVSVAICTEFEKTAKHKCSAPAKSYRFLHGQEGKKSLS